MVDIYQYIKKDHEESKLLSAQSAQNSAETFSGHSLGPKNLRPSPPKHPEYVLKYTTSCFL